MDEVQGSDTKVSWNMAQLLNIELSNLRQKANYHYIQGNFKRAVDSLKAMAQTAIHVMTKEERDKLKEIDKEFKIPLIVYNGLGSFNPQEINKAKIASLKLSDSYSKYNEVLMDILNVHGFLGEYKKDAGSMKI